MPALVLLPAVPGLIGTPVPGTFYADGPYPPPAAIPTRGDGLNYFIGYLLPIPMFYCC